MCFLLPHRNGGTGCEPPHPSKKEEMMKKVKDGKEAGKTKLPPKHKKAKEAAKVKIPVISNYSPEELPKR